MDEAMITEICLFRPRLVKRAYRLCGNHADAEDLASETVLRALTANPGKNPNLAAWLFTILRGKYIDMKRAPYVARRDWNDDFSQLADLPSETDMELFQHVMRFSDALKQQDVEVLTLAALGNSCKEISARLGISYDAAQSRWFRACSRLRIVMGHDVVRRGKRSIRYRGVYPHQGKWRVRLAIGPRQFVGKSGFKYPEQAAEYYNDLAILHLGDRAVLNDI